MMATTTKIEFEHENRVYYSGDVLKGRATLVLGEEKLLRGIYIRIHGFGHCEWPHYDHRNPADKTTEGNETYIDERIYVVGNRASDAGDIRVAAGTYTYQFECQLPIEIPSSLEIDCGSIKYIANLVLDRPSWQIATPDFPFSVIKPFDLSTDATIHEPLTAEMGTRFNVCCMLCCWESEPLHVVVTIPKAGYIPNETINLDVDVKNPSTEHISGILVHIIQRIEAYANDGKEGASKSMNKLCFKMLDGIRNGEDKRIHGQIVVPVTLPSDTTTSNIFKVSYALQIMALPGLCYENLVMEIPIKIGTHDGRRSSRIIARERHSQTIVSQPSNAAPIEPILSNKGQPYRPNSTNDPPTYEEAVAP